MHAAFSADCFGLQSSNLRMGSPTPQMKEIKRCDRCGEAGVRKMGARLRFCDRCQVARFKDNGGAAAHNAVRAAVRQGILPPVKTQLCADCGATACDYDHRDYAKPLEVDPVCRKCNRARGPARPVLTFELP